MPVEHIPSLHPALTFLNELHLVPMATNEPSVGSCSDCSIVNNSAPSESTEPVYAASIEPANELETLSSASIPCYPRMQLNLSNLSPYRSEVGYVVTKTMYHSIHLRATAVVEPHPFGIDARLTPTSEIGEIPL